MNIWEIVLSCIVSAGGVGGVVLAVIHFSSNMIAERLSAQYENKLQLELEKYKTELGKKEYISKTRFDLELSIYKELSKSFFTLVMSIHGLIATESNQQLAETYNEGAYKLATESFLNATEVLYANCPFIQSQLYDQFNNICDLCKEQIEVFDACCIRKERQLTTTDHIRTKTIKDDWDKLVVLLRDHLSSLDVL